MTEAVTEAPDDEAGPDAGTYEVLRVRLAERAAELARRAEALDARRRAVFGGTELRLVGTVRIRTGHPCLPRDIVALGEAAGPPGADGGSTGDGWDGRDGGPGGGREVRRGLILFGHNAPSGPKPETTVGDVFSLHSFVREATGDGTADGRTTGGGIAGGSTAGGNTEVGDAGGEDFRLDPVPLFRDPRFERDFAELHRYYRGTRLLRLHRTGERLLAVFRAGPQDVRVLRWRVGADGALAYLDDRGERDHVPPPPYDFEWVPATRDDHVPGRRPYISIRGRVHVDTAGGLTVKAENDAGTGERTYREPVAEPLQSLADADVHHAEVGPLILLRIRPYNETEWRHLVFNTRTGEVVRLDGIGRACRRLPEDQGIVFPGGYLLSTGTGRTFDTDVSGLEFERAIRSPDGEDVLYVFHAPAEGRSLLLPYNVIRKEVSTPLPCHGHTLLDDGTLLLFRAASDEPTRIHPVQVWRTPYVSDLHAAAQPAGTGPLERIGNAELVRGISDCVSVARMVEDTAPSAPVFEALIAACARVFDRHHWLDEHGLHGPLTDVRSCAGQVLEEFEKVRALTGEAAAALESAAEEIASLVRRAHSPEPRSAREWITHLSELRRARGHLVTLRGLRHVDTGRIDALDAGLGTELDAATRRAAEFLSGEDAFADYHAEVGRLVEEAGGIATTAEAGPVGERLAAQARGLEIVAEAVGTLDVAGATVRTAILERVGEVLGGVNRARAALDARRGELLSREGGAAFAAEFALLGQSVTGALALADTPERCDEQLGRLTLHLEGLEARFAEFDDFLTRLAAERENVHEAFSARRQALLDERARRADRLAVSAGRILDGIRRRAAGLGSPDEVNTYFGSDPMVARLRGVTGELRALGETTRAEELEGRIASARQEAGRALRDRLDLYTDGGTAIRLGRHRFAVATRDAELTLVPHEGRPVFTVTGTGYRAPVRDASFAATLPFWDQPLVSENAEVYRAEHLAAAVLAAAEAGAPDAGGSAVTPDALRAAAAGGGLLEIVRAAARDRYDEGYERGVHDHDAAAILAALLRLRADAGLLRHPPAARAAAQLFWTFGVDGPVRERWSTRVASLARARALFGRVDAVAETCRALGAAVAAFTADLGGTGGPPDGDGAEGPHGTEGPHGAEGPHSAEGPYDADVCALAGEYLFEELACEPPGFVTGAPARSLLTRFDRALGAERRRFDDDLLALGDDLAARHRLVRAWLEAFEPSADLPEAVAVLLCDTARYDSPAALTVRVGGLLGAHPRITGGALELRLDEFLGRTRRFRERRVPAYRAYRRRRDELVAAERARLRLEEYRPKVMSAFVRNELLDEVYLPLVGDSLARQLGTAGDADRADRSGLLLLVSPPGYGKTTLMEYVADRLGLMFVKVSGPALGHLTTSLDPARAPDAAARREVEKISFALELGTDVLLHLDDIQHTSPELLQRFVSLCDGQRRMEGVWDGESRTYDLRGKRFAVCMAGNPYTESGARFRVPDMLANRADVWNLGEVLSGREELFALSYIDNALTSSPFLAPLSARDRGDVRLLVRLAEGDPAARADRLSHPYSAAELDEVLPVLRHLLRVRRVVLACNRAYIDSAARSDASRTEPPFRLQGSYRDMNRLAARIVPVMNEAEVDAVIDDHYLGEARTLASGAEANLLKLAELRGVLTAGQAARWAEVKAAYLREKALGGAGDDPVARTVGAVGLLADRVGGVRAAIEEAAARLSPAPVGSSAPCSGRAGGAD
ncbi:DNA repair ATPase [Streptosporangium sp. NPDC004379]|uniref:DNA repair ATPase n=1 Tax=Streptosporangium sp. NPDC004379 TaxID=3366189 RepID=UPI0036D0374F